MKTRKFAHVLAFAVVVVLTGCLAAMAATSLPRPFQIERYILFLDGQFAGYPAAVDGGGIIGDVVQYTAGDACYPTKLLRGVKYEDIHISSRIPLSPELYEWVGNSLTCEPDRRDGLAASVQMDQSVLWAKEFHNALISEMGFPAMDAANKEPGFLTVGISVEGIRRVAAAPQGPLPGRAKTWLSSNFSLSIPGLDTSAVRRIEIPKVTREIIEYRQGDDRLMRKIPGKIEYPNIVVTLPLSKAASWIAWHEDFVVAGNSGAGSAKEGEIVLYSANLKDELARILLHGLGIVQVEPITGEAGAPMARAVIYCTTIEYQQ